MRYPRAWYARPNTYSLSSSRRGPEPEQHRLSLYALQPDGQRRRVELVLDREHAEALGKALLERVGQARNDELVHPDDATPERPANWQGSL